MKTTDLVGIISPKPSLSSLSKGSEECKSEGCHSNPHHCGAVISILSFAHGISVFTDLVIKLFMLAYNLGNFSLVFPQDVTFAKTKGKRQYLTL